MMTKDTDETKYDQQILFKKNYISKPSKFHFQSFILKTYYPLSQQLQLTSTKPK